MGWRKVVPEESKRKQSHGLSRIGYGPSYWVKTLTQWVLLDVPELDDIVRLLQAGATVGAAFGTKGIPSKVAYAFLKRGRDSQEEGTEDTAESILWRKCHAAIATARALTEAEYRTLSPGKWLSIGPGRMIDEQWREEESNIQQGSTLVLPSNDAMREAIAGAMKELLDAGINPVPHKVPVITHTPDTDRISDGLCDAE